MLKTSINALLVLVSLSLLVPSTALASAPVMEPISAKLEPAKFMEFFAPDLDEAINEFDWDDVVPEGGLPERVYGGLFSLATSTDAFGLYPDLDLVNHDEHWLPEWVERMVSVFRPKRQRVRLSSRFGKRFHPVLKRWKLHNGIDIAAPTGTPVLAASGGIVQRAKYTGASGKLVKINHGDGWVSSYAHLNVIVPSLKPGDTVQAGQKIGEVGSTGRSTGPHLHFVIKDNGKPVNPLTLDEKEFDYVSPVASATRILNFYRWIRPALSEAQLKIKATE